MVSSTQEALEEKMIRVRAQIGESIEDGTYLDLAHVLSLLQRSHMRLTLHKSFDYPYHYQYKAEVTRHGGGDPRRGLYICSEYGETLEECLTKLSQKLVRRKSDEEVDWYDSDEWSESPD
jgi:hypothetical protein